MFIVASKPPKDFTMGNDGKVYADSFVPAIFKANSPAPTKEKVVQEPTKKPQISIER